jgi:hypothetical protein
MSRRCTTHHHACDCREGMFAELEKENAELRSKLAVATEALNRLDKITVLAESARYIIKEALVTIEGNHE